MKTTLLLIASFFLCCCKFLVAQGEIEIETQEILKDIDIELQKAIRLPSPLDISWRDTTTRSYLPAYSHYLYPLRFQLNEIASPIAPKINREKNIQNFIRAGGGLTSSFVASGLIQETIKDDWNIGLQYQGDGAIYTRRDHNPYHNHQLDLFVQTDYFKKGNLQVVSTWNKNNFSFIDTLYNFQTIPELYSTKNVMTRKKLHALWQSNLNNEESIYYKLFSNVILFDHNNRLIRERFLQVGTEIHIPFSSISWITEVEADLGFSTLGRFNNRQHHFLKLRSGIFFEEDLHHFKISPGILLSKRETKFFPTAVWTYRFAPNGSYAGLEWNTQFNRHSFEQWTQINPYLQYINADSLFHFRQEFAIFAGRDNANNDFQWKSRVLYRIDDQLIGFLPDSTDARRSAAVIQDLKSIGAQVSSSLRLASNFKLEGRAEKLFYFHDDQPWQLPTWYASFGCTYAMNKGRWSLKPLIDLSGRRTSRNFEGQHIKSEVYTGFHVHQTYRLGRYFNLFLEANNLLNNRQVLWYINKDFAYKREAIQLIGGIFIQW